MELERRLQASEAEVTELRRREEEARGEIATLKRREEEAAAREPRPHVEGKED